MRIKRKTVIISALIPILLIAGGAIGTVFLLEPAPEKLAFSHKAKSGAAWDAIWTRTDDWVAHIYHIYERYWDTGAPSLSRNISTTSRKQLLEEYHFLILSEDVPTDQFYFVNSSLEEEIQFVAALRLIINVNLLQCLDYIENGNYELATQNYRKLLDCLSVLSSESEICMWMRETIARSLIFQISQSGIPIINAEARQWIETIAIPECMESLKRGLDTWEPSFLKQYALYSELLSHPDTKAHLGEKSIRIIGKEIELHFRVKSYAFFGKKAPLSLELHWSYIRLLGSITRVGNVPESGLFLNRSPEQLEAGIDKSYNDLLEWLAENPAPTAD